MRRPVQTAGSVARNAPQIGQQLLLYASLGARTYPVNGLDEKIDQVVGHSTAAQMDESGQPGEPRRLRMAAQFVRRLDRDSPPVALQIVRPDAAKQISGELDLADQLQLGEFALNAGEIRPPRAGAQLQEQAGAAADDRSAAESPESLATFPAAWSSPPSRDRICGVSRSRMPA